MGFFLILCFENSIYYFSIIYCMLIMGKCVVYNKYDIDNSAVT